MLSFRDLLSAFRNLEIEPRCPIIVHTSVAAFGEIHGGVDTLLGALLTVFPAVMAPAFTFKTMLIPEDGPPGNAMTYGTGRDANKMAEFYDPNMPVDRLMGILPEALRRHPRARRSMHPLLSYTGVNVERYLERQTLADPTAPLQALWDADGWVVLSGVDHTVNTSLHLAEHLAGRPGFQRWALTPQGVVACPGFHGCSDGFEALTPALLGITRQVQAGSARVRALPLRRMIPIARQYLEADPLALLCHRTDCERCNTVRHQVTVSKTS